MFKACLLLLATVAGGAQEMGFTIPVTPLLPTREDCAQLRLAYEALLSEGRYKSVECMRTSPTNVGMARTCSGGTALVAWVQCKPYELRQCALEKRRDSEYRICMSRVLIPANGGESGARETAARRLKTLNDLIDRGESLRNKAGQLIETLESPKKLYAAALTGHDSMLQSLTAEPMHASTDGVDPDLAEEVYRSANRYSDTALSTTANPLIRSIQTESLRRIQEAFQQRVAEAQLVAAEIQSFAVDVRRQLVPMRAAPVRPAPGGTRASDNCALLGNAKDSRELMDKDSDAWLELVRQCQSADPP